jgi:hypothetical protein
MPRASHSSAGTLSACACVFGGACAEVWVFINGVFCFSISDCRTAEAASDYITDENQLTVTNTHSSKSHLTTELF